ncbi:hypothetical protein TSAR_013552, partial [Trichomalopsis sarcophagae]
MDQHYEKMRDDLECVPTPVVGSSNIQDYFAGKSVFMTGATGFMGKCFVEKILRDCPGLKRLYVLVRPRKGVPLEDKMRRYFGNYVSSSRAPRRQVQRFSAPKNHDLSRVMGRHSVFRAWLAAREQCIFDRVRSEQPRFEEKVAT